MYTVFVNDVDLQIGEVAARAGVSIDTVRYYEKRQLLTCVSRSTGGFRRFTPETVERIEFIKQAQDMGLSLDEIKELLTSDGGPSQCQRVHDLLQEKIKDLDEQIKKFRDFRRTLADHLSACENELQTQGASAACPAIGKIQHRTRKGKENEAKANP